MRFEQGARLLFEGKRMWGFRKTSIRGLPMIDGSRLDIPAYEKISGIPGPMFCVVAGKHPGPEVTAIATAVRSGLELSKYPLKKGRILIIPHSNILGAYAGTHDIPITDEDLNRCYPGDVNGSYGERAAHFIFEALKERFVENSKNGQGVLIDLHNEERSQTYLRRDWKLTEIQSGDSGKDTGSEDKLADAFGITVVHEYPREIYEKRSLHRSITGAITNDPKFPGRAYTIELGESDATDASNIAVGVRSILRAMAFLGLIDDTAVLEGNNLPRIATSKDGLLLVPVTKLFGTDLKTYGIATPGYPNFIVAPNQKIAKGEVLGELIQSDVLATPGGSPIQFVAPADGYVISLPTTGVYFPGNDISTLAVHPRELANLKSLGLLTD